MPKPGYFKCNYCYTFFPDKNQTALHEKTCTYNPINKHCDTCRYRMFRILDDGTREYYCNKDFDIVKSEVACKGEKYSKASIIELKNRSLVKEFQ